MIDRAFVEVTESEFCQLLGISQHFGNMLLNWLRRLRVAQRVGFRGHPGAGRPAKVWRIPRTALIPIIPANAKLVARETTESTQ